MSCQDEQLANISYIAMIKDATTKGVLSGIPNIHVPFFKAELDPDPKYEDDDVIMHNSAARQGLVRGLREHKGSATFKYEPNVMGYLADHFMEKISTSGGDPYIHTFSSMNVGCENSYSWEEKKGALAFRHLGGQISKITPSFDRNRGKLEVELTFRSAFMGAEVASVTLDGSDTEITFTTKAVTNPTNGLFVADVLKIWTGSAYVEATIAAIDSIIQVTVTGDVTGTVSVGDIAGLKPQTPSFITELSYCEAGITEWKQGADMTAALAASADDIELDSTWNMFFNMENDTGNHRYGHLDPAAIVKTSADGEISVKRFFKNLEEYNRMMQRTDVAWAIQSNCSNSGYYALWKYYKTQIKEGKKPLESGSIVYSELPYAVGYDKTNSKHMELVIANSVATI